MKKLMKVALTCLLGLLVIACGKDDPAPALPTISSTSDQIQDGIFKGVYGHQNLTVKISGTASQGFEKLSITKLVNGVTTVIAVLQKSDVVIKGSAFEYTFVYQLLVEDIMKDFSLGAEVTDAKGAKANVALANVKVLRKLTTFEITQDADDSETNVYDYNYFLSLFLSETGLATSEVPKASVSSYDQLALDKNYEQIHLVFDYNPGPKIGLPAGGYFASPKATATTNPKLVQNFTTKNETLLKIAEYSALSPADLAKLNALSVNDAHFLAELFEKLPSGSNNQLVSLNKPSSYFVLLKTNTGHVALIDEIEFSVATQVNYKLHIGTRD